LVLTTDIYYSFQYKFIIINFLSSFHEHIASPQPGELALASYQALGGCILPGNVVLKHNALLHLLLQMNEHAKLSMLRNAI
jgi:hypothetical protein